MRYVFAAFLVLFPPAASSYQLGDHPAAILELGSGMGTACYVRGQWWTMWHVVESGEPITWRRGPWSAPGTITVRDVDNDLALISVQGAPPSAWLEWSDRELQSGDPVTLYGWIPDQRLPVTVHGHAFYGGEDGRWRLDALVWPGMSGSCVVDDANGKVWGLAAGITYPGGDSPFRSVAFAVRPRR